MNYEAIVDSVLKEVSEIMREAKRSYGVTIEISVSKGEVPTISYEIREKVII